MERDGSFDGALRVKAALSARCDSRDTKGSPERTLPEGPKSRGRGIVRSNRSDGFFRSGNDGLPEVSQNPMRLRQRRPVYLLSRLAKVPTCVTRMPETESSPLDKLRDHRVTAQQPILCCLVLITPSVTMSSATIDRRSCVL
jgi:hypothetical protein